MKHENVFGLPMTVGSRDELTAAREEGDGPDCYVVMRVEDQPESVLPLELRKRVLRTPCEECGAICRYDPKHYLIGTTIICMPCAGLPVKGVPMKQQLKTARRRDLYGDRAMIDEIRKMDL